MRTGTFQIVGAILLSILSISPGDAAREIPAITNTSDNVSVDVSGEARLRKLHLVRPDLIPYPIAYEVYC